MSERQKPSGYGTGEYEEKRSRFIGELWAISDEEEAKAYLTATRKKYPDARHHCWAWILPDGSCRWSDDGEPGGTAGAPIADILKSNRLYGVFCVVTRYFGGTLLGSGGLVRAYSRATTLALSNAGTEPDPEKAALEIFCSWENLDRIHRFIRDSGGLLLDTDYTAHPDRAVLRAELPADKAEAFLARIPDMTGGRDSGKIISEKKGKSGTHGV